ncbi:MAG: hypothetical protein KDK70_41210, partial [Myxococcales bacterium]|nr:hypothetical protein [Myxococcales bacterium]
MATLRAACLERKAVAFSSAWERIADASEASGAWIDSLVRILPPVSECRAEEVLASADMARAFATSTDRSQSAEAEQQWRVLSDRLTVARAEGAVGHHERAVAEADAVVEVAERLGLRYLHADALLVRGVYGLRVAEEPEEWSRARGAIERAGPLALEAGSNRLAAQVYARWAQLEPRWTPPPVLHAILDVAEGLARSLPSDRSSRALLDSAALARADLWAEEGRRDDAIALYQHVARTAEDERNATLAAHGEAEVLLDGDDAAAAREVWEELRARLEQRDPADPLLVDVYFNLAVVASGRGEHDRALELVALAEAILTGSGARDELKRDQLRVRRAWALERLGEHDQAARVLREVLIGFEHRGARAEELHAEACGLLVDIELELDRPDAARAVAERQLAFVAERQPDDAAALAWAQANAAVVVAKVGDHPRATALIEAARAAMPQDAPAWRRVEVEYAYATVAHAAGDREGARRAVREVERMLQALPNSADALAQV